MPFGQKNPFLNLIQISKSTSLTAGFFMKTGDVIIFEILVSLLVKDLAITVYTSTR